MKSKALLLSAFAAYLIALPGAFANDSLIKSANNTADILYSLHGGHNPGEREATLVCKSDSLEIVFLIYDFETRPELVWAGYLNGRYFKRVLDIFTDDHNFTALEHSLQLKMDMYSNEFSGFVGLLSFGTGGNYMKKQASFEMEWARNSQGSWRPSQNIRISEWKLLPKRNETLSCRVQD